MLIPLAFDINLLLYIVMVLCIGSTMSALTYRWQHRAAAEWRKEAHEFLELPYYEPDPLKFSQGRSLCPRCNRKIKCLHLIPLLSYALLRGRCSHCQQSISLRYPIIELSSAALLLPLYWMYPISTEFGITLILVCALICALIIDAEDYWLPDECSFVVLCCATLLFQMRGHLEVLANISAALFAYFFIFSLRYIFLKLRNVEAIGLGDAKLLAVLVYWLGFSAFTPILLLASVLGLMGALVMRKRLSSKIPFGPYLITAALGYFYLGYFL